MTLHFDFAKKANKIKNKISHCFNLSPNPKLNQVLILLSPWNHLKPKKINNNLNCFPLLEELIVYIKQEIIPLLFVTLH